MLKLTSYPVVMLLAFISLGFAKYATLNNLASSETYSPAFTIYAPKEKKAGSDALFSNADYLYKSWDLARVGLSEAAFEYALKGYDYLSKTSLLAKKNILSIVDFSKVSSKKRLFVLDITTGKILFNTLVAHGHNSGNEYASQFSNLPESHQSSLGFYVTLGTYFGGNGYSLRLKGCEKGINDKAFERAIVIHGAKYVSDSFIDSRGFLGRSYGCPSVPTEVSKDIIDVIKNGSCLFVYHPTKNYIQNSTIINSQDLVYH
ncbi:MAG: murein L,D-transpeptidase catalytic domain-containing protein [Ferruginibacter sp.]